MDTRLRTTRTLKVTEVEVPPEQREMLAQLYLDPRYEALLDLMERSCIALETAHLNTGVGDPEAVLGGHALTKGVWQFYIYVQKQVMSSYATRASEEDEAPAPSLNDVLQGVE